MAEEPRRGWRVVVLIGLALTIAILAAAFIWPFTDLIAAHDVGVLTGTQRAIHLQTAREAVRTELLTLGAGLFAATALVYTARNYALTRKAVELSESGQVTDRYTKAVALLGSEKLDERIGGIYALERIARDSGRDYPVIIEVLCAFIRQRSHEPWSPPKEVPGARRKAIRPDIQAALTVLARRRLLPNYTEAWVDLKGADLAGADFGSGDFAGANLVEADLATADLLWVNFSRTNLRAANLSDVLADGANFSYSKLIDANLGESSFLKSNFTGADLRGATLSARSFPSADLTDAYWPAGMTPPNGWERSGAYPSAPLARSHKPGAEDAGSNPSS